MCSVVGYVGKKQSCEFILEGLRRLEYRGYDSAGFACLDSENNTLCSTKATGQLSNLVSKLQKKIVDGSVAIGHTRWATHGKAMQKNAHPQLDCQQQCAVVHNGIIENFQSLKTKLEATGHSFFSDTDTEVIAHLFEEYLMDQQDPAIAFWQMVTQLEGAYACVVLSVKYPDTLFVARRGSPLCIGIGENELFVASDPLAFSGHANSVVFLPEKSFALLKAESYSIYNHKNERIKVKPQSIDAEWIAAEKDGHEHFMLKEIYEQKQAIDKSVQFYNVMSGSIEDHLGLTKKELQEIEHVTLIGCGTSWHAGRIAEFFFEEIVGIPATAALSSEFRHRKLFRKKKELYIAISQSGETADTLEAMRLINKQKQLTVALTNVASSSMVRECQGFLLTQAGPEVAVASTKAFSTQLTALYWLAHRMALEKKKITKKDLIKAEQELMVSAELLESLIERYKHEIIVQDAPLYSTFSKYIFLGRHISYPFALEAALKLKEISYIFSQAYPAGELKHGPLALVDESVPVFVMSHADPAVYQKLLANVQEVKARNGHVIAFACEGQTELISLADRAFIVPEVTPLLTPLVMTGLMQFFCYAVAKSCGKSIDKPRNLAKSVTVE